MPIPWTEDLRIGVPLVDEQHQEIFRQVNALLEATRNGTAGPEVHRTFAFLSGYVVRHFRAEEQLMAQHGYAGAAVHRAEHQAFVRDLTALAKDYHAQGPAETLVLRLERRVIDWLLTHVGRSDRALGEFLKSRL